MLRALVENSIKAPQLYRVFNGNFSIFGFLQSGKIHKENAFFQIKNF